MKKLIIGLLGGAVMFAVVPETMAGHHHGNEGLHLAAGIINLVKTVVAPTTVVVAPAPAPAVVTTLQAPVIVHKPVVIAPAPRHHAHKPPMPPHKKPNKNHHKGHRR